MQPSKPPLYARFHFAPHSYVYQIQMQIRSGLMLCQNWNVASLDVASPFNRFLGVATTAPHIFGKNQMPFG